MQEKSNMVSRLPLWLTIELLGSKNVMINGAQYLYEGDLDREGKACGFGELVKQNTKETINFSGTFLND